MTSDQYQAVVDTARKKYPPLAPHKFSILTGSHPSYFSEMYPAHERMNPRPGTHVIETYEKGRAIQSTENIEAWLTGEMLHVLGGKDREGKPYDPIFRAMKEEFIGSFSKEQLEEEKALHEKRGDRRPFEQAFDVSQSDAFIRSHIFPAVNDPAYEKFLRPDQRKLLDRMKDYLQTGVTNASQDSAAPAGK